MEEKKKMDSVDAMELSSGLLGLRKIYWNRDEENGLICLNDFIKWYFNSSYYLTVAILKSKWCLILRF